MLNISPDLTGTSASYDWGVYNAISNGGNQAGLWRTLTKGEWEYLIGARNSASSKIATGRIQTGTSTYANGLIILPDDWSATSTPAFTPGVSSTSNYTQNTYTTAQWTQMENLGAIFLPAAGGRYETTISNANNNGLYWSSTHKSGTYSYGFSFHDRYVGIDDLSYRCFGYSVRLVQEEL